MIKKALKLIFVVIPSEPAPHNLYIHIRVTKGTLSLEIIRIICCIIYRVYVVLLQYWSPGSLNYDN